MGEGDLLAWARRHLRWLLCFALLLPAAQVAAAAHLLTHLRTEQQEQQRHAAKVHADACPICSMAGAVGAGGLPSIVAVFHATEPSAVSDTPVAPPGPDLAPLRRFSSRAPPALLH